MLTGIGADETGSVASGKAPDGLIVKFSKFKIGIEDYNRGEAFEVRLVSDDGGLFASDTVYPFPIEAQDGACHLWAQLMSTDRKAFLMIGTGFGSPGSDVRTASSEDGGKDLLEGTTQVNPYGLLSVLVQHRKRGGLASFTAAGQECRVTVQYEFGRRAKGPL